MTELEFNEKVDEIEQIMEETGIYSIDDYFTDMFKDKENNFLFRVKHQRFYESQEDANEVLMEVYSNLKKYEKN
jgi:uncharacterized protein (DUF2267 family)